jgi:hypothetical protein
LNKIPANYQKYNYNIEGMLPMPLLNKLNSPPKIYKKLLIIVVLLLVIALGFFMGMLIRNQTQRKTYGATFVSACFNGNKNQFSRNRA